MKKKDLPLIIGLIIVFIGLFLPAIRIANENISFLKECGCFPVILLAIIFVLYKLNKKRFIVLPSVVYIFTIVKFALDNKGRLQQINELYNCYAGLRYGLLIMFIGNMLMILVLLITEFDYIKILNFIKDKLVVGKNFILKLKPFIFNVKEKFSNLKTKQELHKNIVKQEQGNDGVIKYNKMVVKLNNKKVKQKRSLKEIISIKKVDRKKISLSKFNDIYKEKSVSKKTVTCKVPIIDITKWTRSDVCCINCGATVSSNSDYCFLCDCKVKLNEKHEKLS